METLTPEFMKQYGISEILNSFRGGQKIVYIVVDTKGRKLAMKSFIHCTARDIQEIAILERLKEIPGISKIVKTEKHGESHILFEEYIDAPDLEDILDSYKNDAKRVATFANNVIQILKPIWEQKIIHRDLKPKNIKILEDGSVVILDFGIARDLTVVSITDTGATQPMSWDYASPEQFNGDKTAISYRTDMFSLGVIAYRLYYGHLPFGKTREEILKKFAEKNSHVDLKESDPLNNYFTSSLSVDPSGRPGKVDLLLATLTPLT